MKVRILPIPRALQADVACIRLAEHEGDERLAIHVCLNGMPGIAYHHDRGQSPLEAIVTHSGRSAAAPAPTLFVYGQMTEASVMNHRQGPFSTIQVVLKPQALQTLLGLNAGLLTNALVGLSEISGGDLNLRLMEAQDDQERTALLTQFLLARLKQEKSRDRLIDESLRLIQRDVDSVTVKGLVAALNLSERQFERRFQQTVGVAPQFYIRVKRFNAAIRLMKSRRYARLTDVAYALNYYDQSHFIRDMKAFSGITPRSLAQRVDDFQPGQDVLSYV